MKTAQTILSGLGKVPQFHSMHRHKCYDKYLQMLPERFRAAVGFVYVRKKVMYIALSHPGFKMELELNKNTLLDLIQILRSSSSECSDLEADKIILFASKYASMQSTDNDTDTIPRYHEHATGNFIANIKNKKLKKQFDKLKKSIRKNIK